MKIIRRDTKLLAHTEFCDETEDGGIDLRVGHILYELSPERIANGPAFGQTLLELRQKRWFTDAVQCDFTNVVTARWIAGAQGWNS